MFTGHPEIVLKLIEAGIRIEVHHHEVAFALLKEELADFGDFHTAMLFLVKAADEIVRIAANHPELTSINRSELKSLREAIDKLARAQL